MAAREWLVMRVGDDGDLIVIDDSEFDLDNPVKVCTVHSDGRSPFTVEDNTWLIAAAPDLLAALEVITDHIERIGDSRKDAPFIASARAAIAKAKGA